MLPEVGASEMIVLAAVALIVVGPKDLPVLLRRVGQMVRKVRLLAADFRASFDDMARQSELDDLRKEVEALRQNRVIDQIGASAAFDDINQSLQPTSVTSTFDDSDQSLQPGSDVPYDPHAEGIEDEGMAGEPSHSILPPDAEPVPLEPAPVRVAETERLPEPRT